jgi:mono/diheme cytochrome c family protein
MKLIPVALAAALAIPATLSAAPKGEEAFKAECSACHIAYPSGFMPMRSWTAIMSDLSNHFGEDASLDEATRAEIEAYLTSHAADTNGTPRWLKSVPETVTPLRITEFGWFTHEHGSRMKARVAADPTIGSMSNCAACHRGAERGFFDDD